MIRKLNKYFSIKYEFLCGGKRRKTFREGGFYAYIYINKSYYRGIPKSNKNKISNETKKMATV